MGGSGGEGLLRPTEFDLSRLDDNVLDRNDDGLLDVISLADLWLLVVNLRPISFSEISGEVGTEEESGVRIWSRPR